MLELSLARLYVAFLSPAFNHQDRGNPLYVLAGSLRRVGLSFVFNGHPSNQGLGDSDGLNSIGKLREAKALESKCQVSLHWQCICSLSEFMVDVYAH